MTNDAPKRIWAWYIRTQNGIWLAKNCAQDKRPNHPDAIEYILKTHAQAEKEAAVAACLGRAEELANIHSDWAADEIAHYRRETQKDAQAALERVRQEAKAEALREAAELVTREGFGAVHDKILALIPDQHKVDG